MLTENIHYRKLTFKAGEVFDNLLYCAIASNGTAVLLERTHPDASMDDVRRAGVALNAAFMKQQRDQRRGRKACNEGRDL